MSEPLRSVCAPSPIPDCVLSALPPAEQARAIVSYIENTITLAPSDRLLDQYCALIERALQLATRNAQKSPHGDQ